MSVISSLLEYYRMTTQNHEFFFEMALYYELQVFKDVYALVQKVFSYTQEFPREYKYTLGQDIQSRWIAKLLSHEVKRDAIQFVRSIYRAKKAKDKELRCVIG